MRIAKTMMGFMASTTTAQAEDSLIPANMVYIGYVPVSYTHLDVYKRQARGSAAALNQLLALLDGVVPDSAHEQILYTQILQNLNELSKYRNLRHQATHEELPLSLIHIFN